MVPFLTVYVRWNAAWLPPSTEALFVRVLLLVVVATLVFMAWSVVRGTRRK